MITPCSKPQIDTSMKALISWVQGACCACFLLVHLCTKEAFAPGLYYIWAIGSLTTIVLCIAEGNDKKIFQVPFLTVWDVMYGLMVGTVWTVILSTAPNKDIPNMWCVYATWLVYIVCIKKWQQEPPISKEPRPW